MLRQVMAQRAKDDWTETALATVIWIERPTL